MSDPIIIAVPKGRILDEALPLLARVGIEPEAAFADEGSRALRFATSDPAIELIRVRAFAGTPGGGRRPMTSSQI